jgi:DNA mismatch repair protein MutS
MNKAENSDCLNNTPKPTKLTPVMEQYFSLKVSYPDCLLFFRMGDFYELFYEDAVLAAKALDIALTRRGKNEGEDIPMCGVPFHAVDSYLSKLIKHGFRVAVSEQIPGAASKKSGKTLLQREVVRIVTPGTVTEDTILEAKKNNYIVSIASLDDEGGVWALAVCDLSTGEFWVESGTALDIQVALGCLDPSEVIISEGTRMALEMKAVIESLKQRIVCLSAASFADDLGQSHIKRVFNVSHIEALGDFRKADFKAIAGLLDYILMTQKGQIPRLNRPVKRQFQSGLEMDHSTRRNFELTRTISGEKKGSLLWLMDHTCTSFGGRLFNARLSAPLADYEAINARLEATQWGYSNDELRAQLRDILSQIGDIERSLSRLKLGRGGPRDAKVIRESLKSSARIFLLLQSEELPPILYGASLAISGHDALVVYLESVLADDLPFLVRDGGFIRDGYHSTLDELRHVRDHGKQLIAALQAKYVSQMGINTLRIKHNNFLGYYIEVAAGYSSKLTPEFIHRQTMAGAMRFTTLELSELETKMIEATDQALQLELVIYEEILEKIFLNEDTIIKACQALAELDVALSLAELARHKNYIRPQITNDRRFNIKEGRHPIVEACGSSSFIPNDCILEANQNLWLITGPNMAGKSTFLRQNGLMVIMAQMGSFIPAKSAVMGVVDKLFSRVGASDDLSSGRSTFMVEMVETATILNRSTDRSMVILDEVGRGTSTFDGMSIAWSVVEYLGNKIKPRCLFATHYHELTQLSGQVPGLGCYTVKIKEWNGEIFFLHEIQAGQADRSYGLHVASLAGLPKDVMARAKEILKKLESEKRRQSPSKEEGPLPLFDLPSITDQITHPVVDALEKLSLDQLSPKQALDCLYEFKQLLAQKE